jgi:hypothetical protein
LSILFLKKKKIDIGLYNFPTKELLQDNMREIDLIKLGFERVDETPESSGSDEPWYYYAKDIGQIDFLSCDSDSDEAKKGKWTVDVLDGSVVFNKASELKTVIALLEKNKII